MKILVVEDDLALSDVIAFTLRRNGFETITSHDGQAALRTWESEQPDMVLLDYEDSPRGPHGVYVGTTQYAPAARFDQHKAGIRSAGSVLKRGLELLPGPVLHLQGIPRAAAEDIEERLAEALRAEGLLVQGGH